MDFGLSLDMIGARVVFLVVSVGFRRLAFGVLGHSFSGRALEIFVFASFTFANFTFAWLGFAGSVVVLATFLNNTLALNRALFCGRIFNLPHLLQECGLALFGRNFAIGLKQLREMAHQFRIGEEAGPVGSLGRHFRVLIHRQDFPRAGPAAGKCLTRLID